MSDGFLTSVGLVGAIANGKSNAGNHKDNKICTAQAGECRFNHRYYTHGMRDAKSWSMPCADESCPARCGYLQDRPAEQLPEEKRKEIAYGIVEGPQAKQASDEAMNLVLLAMMRIDLEGENHG